MVLIIIVQSIWKARLHHAQGDFFLSEPSRIRTAAEPKVFLHCEWEKEKKKAAG